MTLKNKKILVTGGSRGIGASIAKYLTKQGAQVALTFASRSDAAEKVVSELEGEGHFCLKMDIGDEQSIETGMNQVIEKFGGLDGLVNNAGITADQLLLRMKVEDFDRVVQANLRGAFLCTKAVLKPMMKARSGSVVNISSVVAQMGNPGQANYCASKGGLESMTRSMALELSSRNIRLNCVAPGFIATDMTDSLNEKQQETILQRIPLSRMGRPEEVASAVAYLLGDDSGYITGQVLQVNGGLYM